MGWGARSGKYGTNDAGQKPKRERTQEQFLHTPLKKHVELPLLLVTFQ